MQSINRTSKSASTKLAWEKQKHKWCKHLRNSSPSMFTWLALLWTPITYVRLLATKLRYFLITRHHQDSSQLCRPRASRNMPVKQWPCLQHAFLPPTYAAHRKQTVTQQNINNFCSAQGPWHRQPSPLPTKHLHSFFFHSNLRRQCFFQ